MIIYLMTKLGTDICLQKFTIHPRHGVCSLHPKEWSHLISQVFSLRKKIEKRKRNRESTYLTLIYTM